MTGVGGTADRYPSGMDWTTHFSNGGPERSLPGIVLDGDSLGGIDIAAGRTNRVQVTATSGEPFADGAVADLVEFLDVAVRVLDRCAAGPGRWTAVVLTVRQESGSIGALLVDDADHLARSGALVMLSLAGLEEAAAELPWADEDPEGFEKANRALQERVRSAIAAAARAEPAAARMDDFRARTRLPVLLDPVGEMVRADFVPIAGT